MWTKFWPEDIPQKLDFTEKPLYEFLRDNAQRNPGKIAINYYGREIGFQELDDLSDRFATALIDLGLKKGDRVSLYLENCPQFVIAYFGTLKAGAVVVAANPMFKADELLYELKDSVSCPRIRVFPFTPPCSRPKRFSRKHLNLSICSSNMNPIPPGPR
jgi:acyl-CoA synthetase (AMP-forming)/AMP-acid ligase II